MKNKITLTIEHFGKTYTFEVWRDEEGLDCSRYSDETPSVVKRLFDLIWSEGANVV